MMRADAAALPPLTFILSCRHACELIMLAPLLPYAHVLDIRVFYTGKAALTSGSMDLPLPSQLKGSGSVEDGARASRAGSDDGGAAARAVARSRAWRLPAMVGGPWQQLTVWCLTTFIAFWLLVRPRRCASAEHCVVDAAARHAVFEWRVHVRQQPCWQAAANMT